MIGSRRHLPFARNDERFRDERPNVVRFLPRTRNGHPLSAGECERHPAFRRARICHRISPVRD